MHKALPSRVGLDIALIVVYVLERSLGVAHPYMSVLGDAAALSYYNKGQRLLRKQKPTFPSGVLALISGISSN